MASSTSWYCHFWCCISEVFYRVKFSYYCDFDWFLTPSSIQALHFLYVRTQNIKSCQRKLNAILNTQNYVVFCRSAMIMFFFVMQFQHKHFVIYSFVGNSLKFLTKPWRWHSNLPCQHQIDNKPSTNRPFSHDITLPLIFLNKEISLLWEISYFLMQTFSVVWEHQYGRHKNALLSISALENLALCDTSMCRTNWAGLQVETTDDKILPVLVA